MTKIKKSKVSIKIAKPDNNGNMVVKNKTFSKNNPEFVKKVQESKQLLKESNQIISIQEVSNNADSMELAKKDYIESMNGLEKIYTMFDKKDPMLSIKELTTMSNKTKAKILLSSAWNMLTPIKVVLKFFTLLGSGLYYLIKSIFVK